MASITKISERKYLIRISKGTGKKRQFLNKTFRGTLADARTEARRLESQVDSGRTPQAIILTFEKALTQWLRAIAPTVAKRTHEDYQQYIERYALRSLGAMLLTDIKTFHIQTVYIDMSARLSATTVRNLHRVLTAFFNYMVKKEAVRDNPCRNADLPQKSRKEIEVLSADEAAALIGACQDSQNGIIFEFALETGMRPEEYLALRWRDVDFQHNAVSVNQAVVFNRKGGGYYFTKPKTAKSRRLIQISQPLRDRLMSHRRAQNEYRVKSAGTYATLDLVFGNEIGTPYPLNNLTRRYFQPILERAGIDRHVTLYALRHSCATLLLMAGENPKVVADRLGHSSVTLTLDTYSHVLPHIQEAATAKLDNILRMRK